MREPTREWAERLIELDMGNTPWATPKQYLQLLDKLEELEKEIKDNANKTKN